MPCPFPGMDPYIEALGLWEGFHAPMITRCADLLNLHLPGDYVAQIETRVAVVSLDEPPGIRVPDLLIGKRRGVSQPAVLPTDGGGSVATLEPVTVPLARGSVEIRQRWIEIKQLPDLELVTVIEILSPTNKAGDGRSEYVRKRDALLDRPINLVEVDLLLYGAPPPMGKTLPRGLYHAIVARAEGRPNAQVYSWGVRQPLPSIPIPLRSPTPDVNLGLAEAFELTYRLGRFDMIVRHDGSLPEWLPLDPADREWAEAIGR
ncbi:hypothetical protein OJF2_28690 [Aquisphaera giovannonii]|uniref:DUF4058 family protein n=1 Tax=Aquisphaera giovannonii TaxID=406548 RepID=A0A5B9W198_9BACT|nr:DUF4058 family protein [Aquisphaera giovannonii]QEH34333.1 hypothetical protein OJF2_28690 [Aquisphaera giovannonii]